MAVTLRCVFKDGADKEQTMNFKHANKTKGAYVRAFMETVVANSAIYVAGPVSLVSAEFIETTSTPVEL